MQGNIVIWNTLSFISMPLSSAFFFIHNLPATAQQFLLWFPMIHGTEMFRKGYFDASVTTYENPYYIFVFNLILIFIGLIMVRNFSKGESTLGFCIIFIRGVRLLFN